MRLKQDTQAFTGAPTSLPNSYPHINATCDLADKIGVTKNVLNLRISLSAPTQTLWHLSGDIPYCMYPFIYPIYHSYFTFISLHLHSFVVVWL